MGDFEDWIQSTMQTTDQQVVIFDATSGNPLPTFSGWTGILISGSHAMVTDHLAWSQKTAGWLAEAHKREIPMLGICYGHQLLAQALGGKVGDNPNGLEFGTVEIQLTQQAHLDALFGWLPTIFKAHVCHAQTVLKLPPHARLLATSQLDGCQAFSIGKSTWGVQFHPEFSAAALIYYINHFKDQLSKEGKDAVQLIPHCCETPLAARLLTQFKELRL